MKESALQQAENLASSELVLTKDGAVYHLNLMPEQIAPNIIVVGDQGRVAQVSKHFDRIDHTVQNREFLTHTGSIGSFPISVMSTGIGTDNIDIVVNELDALFNIDLQQRSIRSEKTRLNIIRLGTCGALQEDIPVDELLLSTHGMGLDTVTGYYAAEFEDDEKELAKAFQMHSTWPEQIPAPYFVKAGGELVNRINGKDMYTGITATAGGFYGPQGRILRLPLRISDLNESLNSFRHGEHRITNFEMETSALYALSAMLGHQACTVCAVIANRFSKSFSRDYHPTVNRMIATVLERLTTGY